MARIVFISPYLKGGKNAAKLAHRTHYFATRPGVELLPSEHDARPATKKQQAFVQRLLKTFPTCRDSIEYEDYCENPTQGNASAFIQQVWEDYVEALEQKENFIDYISHRPGAQKDGEHGLWDANGKVRNLSAAEKEVSEHTGNVWTPVVALRRADAERLGYDNAENWRAVVNASLCDIAAAYKIKPDHLRWYAALHQKPNQVHIHLIVFSTDPKEGYLTKDGIQQVKSAFARRIYQADRMHVYQRKDQVRRDVQTEARRKLADCITALQTSTVMNPKLEQLVTELAVRLQSTKGRRVYGYLPPRTKAVVDAIVEELAKDPQVASAYEAWQTLYEQVCLDYNQQLPERVPLSQRKEFKAVRNMVIQETLRWMDEQKVVSTEQDRSETVSPDSDSDDGDSTEHAELPEQPEYEMPQSVRPDSTAALFYSPPTVGEAVVRMFHHMGRIFEDNSKTDAIHRGLQMDRKRRMELQRKRLAMGHKADDHEEITMK